MNFLAQIAEDEIVKLHNELETMLKSSMAKAIEIGERLTEAQEEMSVGEYKKWVEEKLPFSMRSAQRYKRAFTHRITLETTAVSLLTKGLDSIKAPKEPKPAEPEVVDPKPVENTNNEPPMTATEVKQRQDAFPEKPPIMDVDAGGMVIPENLTDIFSKVPDMQQYVDELRYVKRQILEHHSGDPEWRYLKVNPFTIDIDNAIRGLKHALPTHVCRFCSGTGNSTKIGEKCPCCKGSGFVNEAMFKATPEELK